MSLEARAERTVRAAGAEHVAQGGVIDPGFLAREGDVLVLSTARVYDKRITSRLAEVEAAPGGHVSATRAPGEPFFAYRVSPALFEALARGLPSSEQAFIDLLGAKSGAETTLTIGDAFAIPANDEAGVNAATEALWNSCRKPSDGLVSRNFNRHLSLFVSRRIVGTPITPNQITIFCLVLAVISAILTAQGGYLPILLGAFLFKANSVLDGVDGEIARVKWQFSKAGETLDAAGDNVANFSYFGALAWAAHQGGQPLHAALGFAGLVMWALYLVFIYAQLNTMGRGDSQMVRTAVDEVKTGPIARVVGVLRLVLRRDSFVALAFLLALIGRGTDMLFFVLFGGAATFGSVLIHYGVRLFRSPAA